MRVGGKYYVLRSLIVRFSFFPDKWTRPGGKSYGICNFWNEKTKTLRVFVMYQIKHPRQTDGRRSQRLRYFKFEISNYFSANIIITTSVFGIKTH